MRTHGSLEYLHGQAHHWVLSIVSEICWVCWRDVKKKTQQLIVLKINNVYQLLITLQIVCKKKGRVGGEGLIVKMS